MHAVEQLVENTMLFKRKELNNSLQKTPGFYARNARKLCVHGFNEGVVEESGVCMHTQTHTFGNPPVSGGVWGWAGSWRVFGV
jgi:hypothetical protein